MNYSMKTSPSSIAEQSEKKIDHKVQRTGRRENRRGIYCGRQMRIDIRLFVMYLRPK